MIRIISGYSDKGGSTSAFIDLTNELNKRGHETIFYGPHQYHLDKCKSGLLGQVSSIDQQDRLICHFINLPSRPNARKVVLMSHEKWWFMVDDNKKYWDEAVFLHEEHRKYHHLYSGSSSIIPNLKPNLLERDKGHLTHVAGIIGSIEDRKQTAVSIHRALVDGCTEIYLFGQILDQEYFSKYVKPLIDGETVKLYGFTENKQEMYDMIGRVYHSSKGEVACLVKDECYLTNTKFFGNEETNNEVSLLTNDEIITKWLKVLEL